MADDANKPRSPYEAFVQGGQGSIQNLADRVQQRDSGPSAEQPPKAGDQKPLYLFLPTDLELWTARQRPGHVSTSDLLPKSAYELGHNPLHLSEEIRQIIPPPERTVFRITGFGDSISHFMADILRKKRPDVATAFRAAAHSFNNHTPTTVL